MLVVRFARRGSLCGAAAPPLWCRAMTGKVRKKPRRGGGKSLGVRKTRQLGKLIRDAREAAGLTRENVLDATGLSVVSQYYAETGERTGDDGKTAPHRVHTATLVKLARLLKITPSQLEACGRDEAAAVLRAPSLPDSLSDEDKARVAAALLVLRRVAPDFETMVGWIGEATGDAPRVTDAADGG